MFFTRGKYFINVSSRVKTDKRTTILHCRTVDTISAVIKSCTLPSAVSCHGLGAVSPTYLRANLNSRLVCICPAYVRQSASIIYLPYCYMCVHTHTHTHTHTHWSSLARTCSRVELSTPSPRSTFTSSLHFPACQTRHNSVFLSCVSAAQFVITPPACRKAQINGQRRNCCGWQDEPFHELPHIIY